MDEHKHLEILAMCVHTAIAILSLLALLHNARKRNWRQVGVCFGVVCYEVQAIYIHYKDLKGVKR